MRAVLGAWIIDSIIEYCTDYIVCSLLSYCTCIMAILGRVGFRTLNPKPKTLNPKLSCSLSLEWNELTGSAIWLEGVWGLGVRGLGV